MATQSTSTPSDVANRLQTRFHPRLLKALQYKLLFGSLEGPLKKGIDLEANTGALTIRYFERRPAAKGNVETLTQGTASSTFVDVDTGYVDCTLVQRGIQSKITDLLRAADLFDWLEQNVETLGEDCALDMDDVIQTAIVAGLNASNGNFEQFAGIVNNTASPTSPPLWAAGRRRASSPTRKL